MKRGIYILANDTVLDNTIALVNSIRYYDQYVKIIIIPYDNNIKKLSRFIDEERNISLFQDLDLIESCFEEIRGIFSKNFFKNIHNLKKLFCWFGPFDEFIYIDTDIVVFEKISTNFKYFTKFDFFNCDYQFKKGLKEVFTDKILKDTFFSKKKKENVFNGGFWGSKKSFLTKNKILTSLREIVLHKEWFDFSTGGTDQPILNYIILKNFKKIANLCTYLDKQPGNWAGMKHFQRKGNVLVDSNCKKQLKFLHWAGISIKKGCPYYNVWKFYRFLGNKSLFNKFNFLDIFNKKYYLNKIKKEFHFNKPPIIIGGCGRSGTTLLISILSAHKDIFPVSWESGNLCVNAYALKSISSSKKRKNISKGLKNLYFYFRKCYIPRSCNRWVEKTPKNISYAKELLEYFENDIKFINIIRDPRDVLLSHHPSSKKKNYITLNRWIADVKFGHNIQSHNFLTIRYEDLVLDFKSTIKKVCSFLDIPFDKKMLKFNIHSKYGNLGHLHENKLLPIFSSSVGKWKNKNSEKLLMSIYNNSDAVYFLKYYNYM